MELYNLKAEQIVLGKLLNESLPEVVKILKSSYFYFDKHKVIYEAILSLQTTAKADIVTVSDFLENKKKLDFIGGSSYLSEIINGSFIGKNVIHYAEIIKNKAELRNFWEFFQQKAEDIKTGKITDHKKCLQDTTDKILAISNSEIENNTTISEICQEYTKLQEEYANNRAEGKTLLGIPTKYASLDRATDGFQPETVWTIAAVTSVGKSSFQINLIKKLLDQDNNL